MSATQQGAPEASLSTIRPKVVYVMGTARSGSTILGVALGNCANVFYAGELGGWLGKSGISRIDGVERERFWASVREQVDCPSDLFGQDALLAIDRSLSLVRVNMWRIRRRIGKRYLGVTEQLYRAIARTAGATHVVDTSSHPLRARELKKLDGIDLYLVYLVRNPHGVVASFTQPGWRFSKSTALTNAYLWLTSLLSVLVFLKHRRDRRIFVRHEEFVADPEHVLREILSRVDASCDLPDLTSLEPCIPFQGNRLLRSRESITLRSSESPPPRSRVTTLLQLPWEMVLSRLRPAASPP
ncbi:MAG: sulfotransferase family protein, partial [Solirubrobacterales bacterium]|nr:sulfotransferase family protein [Solirubrobacterales bacterium]